MLPPDAVIYQLKISLSGVKPTVWRRVLAPGSMALRDLHRVIQVAMGWRDAHLHLFVVDGKRYGVPESEGGSAVGDERRIRLSEVAPGRGEAFAYEYDLLGSRWKHEVLVERMEVALDGLRGPRCLGGRRACPPEDCGGPAGYAHLLEILRDPGHPEHQACREWVGGDFDSSAFDSDQVNEGLVRNGPRARRADLAWLRPGWI